MHMPRMIPPKLPITFSKAAEQRAMPSSEHEGDQTPLERMVIAVTVHIKRVSNITSKMPHIP